MSGPRIARNTIASCALAALALALAPAALPAENPIQVENARTGTPDWSFPFGADGTASGYSTQPSVTAGGSIDLHISTTPAASYRIEVFRLGWYGGTGARQVLCLPSCAGSENGAPQATPPPDPTTGMVRAGWPVTDVVHTGSDWTSGYYVADVVLTSGPASGQAYPIYFVVESAAPAPSAMLVVAAVNTWEAYNNWGGKSLYAFNSSGGAAVKVSFERPYANADGSPMPLTWDYQLIRFLESRGYDVSYTTDVDIDEHPSDLLDHRLVAVVGHDEYWSKTMRDAYEAARAAGTNLAFIGADIADWQIRYEDDHQTIVEYRNASADPEPTLAQKAIRARDLGRPECQLLGISYQGGLEGNYPHPTPFVVQDDPWLAGTGLTAGTSLPGLVGYEWDGVQAGCLPGVVALLHASMPAAADTVRYTAPSGARVFSTGSLQFTWGLDGFGGHDALVNSGLQRFMANALDDLLRPAPPTSVSASVQGTTVTASATLPADSRITGVAVYRHEGAADFGASSPGAILACRATGTSCIDAAAPGHRIYRYGIAAVDRWGASYLVLTPPVAVANRAPRLRLSVPHVFFRGSRPALVRVKASDADGDLLVYRWTLDGRRLRGGATASVPPGRTGMHRLRVSVSDGHGGVVSVGAEFVTRSRRR